MSYVQHEGKLDLLYIIFYCSYWIGHLLREVSWIQIFLKKFIPMALKLLKSNISYCL
jgi:hypothetical protein